MAYKSINPATNELLKVFETISDEELSLKLKKGHDAYKKWRNVSLENRIEFVSKISKILLESKSRLGKLISLEMGKPIKESIAEVEKCSLLCNYYIENAERLLKPEEFESSAIKSYTIYNPIGLIYGVMPWNFPFWQVFRYVIPNLILGNGVLLKHASNVPQCALAIEKVILKSGIDKYLFQNLFIDYEQSNLVIESDFVWGVTLTGSEYAGSKIAEYAGKNIKKTVLELGGSDPFIVLEDANIEQAVEEGIKARFQNTGQSCIAAKRFIIHEKVYEQFLNRFKELVQKLEIGDPLSFTTDIGPIAGQSLVVELENQVIKSVEAGAIIEQGGKRISTNSNYYQPTILSNITKDCPAYYEEFFGPVALIFKVKDFNEAIDLANDSEFGLGASLWTADLNKAKLIADKIESGTISINGMVKSDPALPFGGVKKSGYGREMSELGLKEFANIKTVNLF